jgi:hypothetical protein
MFGGVPVVRFAEFRIMSGEGHLSKPVNTRELPGLVKQWLEEEQL